jgi:hypothetical protein
VPGPSDATASLDEVRSSERTKAWRISGGAPRAVETVRPCSLAFVQGDRDAVLEEVIQRAIDRGEIRPEHVTDRIARLPVNLFRYEILMTLRPLSDEAIEEIVDTIFLPLLDWRRGR